MKVKELVSLLTVVGLGLGSCLPLGAQNLVSKPEKRAEILGEYALRMENLEVALSDDPETLRNPFTAVRPPPVAAPVGPRPESRPVVGPAPVAPSRLSDSVALGVVVQRFKPLGAMVVGDRRILRLSGGTLLEEGESFRIHIQGEFYDVHVDRITLDSYVIRVGSARAERTLSRGSPND